jgi:hypothetical protein
MSHAEAVATLNSFKNITWTDDKGNKLSTSQIASKYGSLADKVRTTKKQEEANQTLQAQQAEIARLQGLLEKTTRKSA